MDFENLTESQSIGRSRGKGVVGERLFREESQHAQVGGDAYLRAGEGRQQCLLRGLTVQKNPPPFQGPQPEGEFHKPGSFK